MLTKSIEVMRYVKASAGRSNLRVVFEDVNQPRHDGSTIYLPRITKKTTEFELKQMMSSTDHEVGHDLYSDFDLLKEKGVDATTSPLGLIWNLLEDSRVNNLEANAYEGFRELWDECTSVQLQEIATKLKASKDGLSVILAAMIKWDSGINRPLFPMCAHVTSSMETDPKLSGILDKFSDRLRECHEIWEKKEGSKATYELARDIFRAMGGDPDEEERKARERKEQEATGKKPKEGQGKEGEDETLFDDESWRIVRGELADNDTFEHRDRMSTIGCNMDIPDSTYHADWNMTPLDDFIVVDYVNQVCNSSALNGLLRTDSYAATYFSKEFDVRVRGKAVTSENFAQQVRRLIQIRSRVKYEYGVKKGKLDQPRLSRLVLKQPGFSDRVFKNKIINTVLDAAVTVLIDMSGSMSGMKCLYACESAVLLNNVFHVLQVPLEILGFTDYDEPPVSYVYKPFNKNHVTEEELISYIGASSFHMQGNPDGDSIVWAYDRLLQRKEKRRLLIVMSDGQPAASRSMGGCKGFTKKVVKEIQDTKLVEIYGLGLCSDSVKDFYQHNSIVNNPEDIPQQLLELIERKLLCV